MAEEKVDLSQLGKGEYADFFGVAKDYVAFYVDCGQQGVDEEDQAKVYTRIITTPIGALRLVDMLAKTLCDYVELFGPIRHENGKTAPQAKEKLDVLCEYRNRFVR